MKYYRAHLSNKETILLDEHDYQKLVEGMTTGSFVKLKKAIVNPSFVVMLLPLAQKEAMREVIPPRKVEGYVDDKTGTFVVTKDETPAVPGLADEFAAA